MKEGKIRRFSLAFLLSIVLHLGLVALLLWILHESKVETKAINRSKITLDLAQIQTLPPKPPSARPLPKQPRPKPPIPPKPKTTPPVPKTPPPPKPRPKMAQKSKTVKKSPKTQNTKGLTTRQKLQKESNASRIKSSLVIDMKMLKPKRDQKEKKERPVERKRTVVKKRVPKPTPKAPVRVAKKSPPKKVHKKRTPPKKATKPQKRRPTPRRHKPTGPDSRLISSLYGSSYSRMSSVQRRFIDENLRRILQISQRTLNYLGYPREAARFAEQGTNIVEFWLYPNGDIRGLRLRKRLRSSSLNRQTLEVIKTAYMHYPRPKVKTKIIIYVRYSLY